MTELVPKRRRELPDLPVKKKKSELAAYIYLKLFSTDEKRVTFHVGCTSEHKIKSAPEVTDLASSPTKNIIDPIYLVSNKCTRVIFQMQQAKPQNNGGQSSQHDLRARPRNPAHHAAQRQAVSARVVDAPSGLFGHTDAALESTAGGGGVHHSQSGDPAAAGGVAGQVAGNPRWPAHGAGREGHRAESHAAVATAGPCDRVDGQHSQKNEKCKGCG
jgi:hypothetical protein